MDENKTIEEYKAKEEELKKQLEEAQAQARHLEMEMKYRDKVTGMWVRKYAESFLTEDPMAQREDFAILCADIENLTALIEKVGIEESDAFYKETAENMKTILGADAEGKPGKPGQCSCHSTEGEKAGG